MIYRKLPCGVTVTPMGRYTSRTTRTERLAAYLADLGLVAGDQIYAYEVARQLGMEPQRVRNLFLRFAAHGFLRDLGIHVLPRGMARGPAVRLFEMTEKGVTHFRESNTKLKVKMKIKDMHGK